MSEENEKPARILCAANRYTYINAQGHHAVLVSLGVRHFDSLMVAPLQAALPDQELTMSNPNILEKEQGFVNVKREFLSRTQAWDAAVANDQILEGTRNHWGEGVLYSEHLY